MLRLLLAFLLGTLASHAEPAPAAQPDERDLKVIESALTHLLANPDFEMVMAKKAAADDSVVLEVHGPNKAGFLETAQVRGEQRREKKVPAELLDATLSRNTKSGYDAVAVSYEGVKLGPKVVVADLSTLPQERFKSLDAFKEAYPKARGYVSLHLPGYSKDGKQAFVRGTAGPSPHGMAVSVLLELRDGQWVAKWSNVSFFV